MAHRLLPVSREVQPTINNAGRDRKQKVSQVQPTINNGGRDRLKGKQSGANPQYVAIMTKPKHWPKPLSYQHKQYWCLPHQPFRKEPKLQFFSHHIEPATPTLNCSFKFWDGSITPTLLQRAKPLVFSHCTVSNTGSTTLLQLGWICHARYYTDKKKTKKIWPLAVVFWLST